MGIPRWRARSWLWGAKYGFQKSVTWKIVWASAKAGARAEGGESRSARSIRSLEPDIFTSPRRRALATPRRRGFTANSTKLVILRVHVKDDTEQEEE